MQSISRPVPTNVITGFLGVGKTTAIRSLLDRKPVAERWAVLVNEFGEVGIDAGLLDGDRQRGVFIREVPGGCMCCAAGLPMQVALNRLLQEARPDRLLIEPTGLGHPKAVIETLRQVEYRSVLDLRAVVTLVDARKTVDDRYAGHEVFRQQLEVADCIVASKQDLYAPGDLDGLRAFLVTLGLDGVPLHTVIQGRLRLAWLEAPRRNGADRAAPNAVVMGGDSDWHGLEVEMPPAGYWRRTATRDGFHTVGWVFANDRVFSHDRLFAWLAGLEAERIKAVAITDRGVTGFNMADGVLTTIGLESVGDSRIEIISACRLDWDAMERELLACLVDADEGRG